MLLGWLRSAVKSTVIAGVGDALQALGLDTADDNAEGAARLLQARLKALAAPQQANALPVASACDGEPARSCEGKSLDEAGASIETPARNGRPRKGERMTAAS